MMSFTEWTFKVVLCLNFTVVLPYPAMATATIILTEIKNYTTEVGSEWVPYTVEGEVILY